MSDTGEEKTDHKVDQMVIHQEMVMGVNGTDDESDVNAESNDDDDDYDDDDEYYDAVEYLDEMDMTYNTLPYIQPEESTDSSDSQTSRYNPLTETTVLSTCRKRSNDESVVICDSKVIELEDGTEFRGEIGVGNDSEDNVDLTDIENETLNESPGDMNPASSQVAIVEPPKVTVYLGHLASNFAKLNHLSLSTCQKVMRQILKHVNPTGKTDKDLQNFLKSNKKSIYRLRKYQRGKKKSDSSVFSSEQIELLLDENVTYENLDMSLMYGLARNLLCEKILRNKVDPWNTQPSAFDFSLQACIEKLRHFRNFCAHLNRPELTDEIIRQKFQHIKDVIEKVENHLQIEPQYSFEVDNINNTKLSPEISELEEKIARLESAKSSFRTAAYKDMKKLLEEFFSDLDMFNDNFSSQDAQTRKLIDNHRRNDQFYVETEAAIHAKKILDEYHHVLLTGRKSCGKSTLAYHLLYHLMKWGKCKVHILQSLADFNRQRIDPDGFVITLIDLGSIERTDEHYLRQITREFIRTDTKLSLYVIMTTRVCNVGCIAPRTYVVDLSEHFTLNSEEKKSLLVNMLCREATKTVNELSFQPSDDELNEIVECPCPISFPLAASLFAENEKYRRLGLGFFINPIDYFRFEIETECRSPESFLVLFLLLFQNEPVSFGDLNPSTSFSKEQLRQIWSERYKHGYQLTKAAEELEGHLVSRSSSPRYDGRFCLINPCVKKAASVFFAKAYPEFTIRNLDQEIIVDREVFSCFSENTSKCYHILTSDSDKKTLADRFLSDIFEKRTDFLSESDAWLDPLFVEILMDVFPAHIEGSESLPEKRIEELLLWAVSNGCLLLCHQIKTFFTRTCFFDARPKYKEELMTVGLVEVCKISQNVIQIANRQISKLSLLQFFVNENANCSYCVDCKDPTKDSTHDYFPLNLLMKTNDDECLRYLLANGGIDPHSNWKYWNLLKTAAKENDTQLCNCQFMRMLCSSNTAELSMAHYNKNLLHVAKDICSLYEINEDNKALIFFSCLQHIGIKQPLMNAFQEDEYPIFRKQKNGYNALHIAIAASLPTLIMQDTISVLAQANLGLLSEENENGETPLSMAVQTNCDTKCVEELLRQSANPNKTTPVGYSPLHLCIQSPLEDEKVSKIVDTLIGYGADIQMKTPDGKTPIDLVILKGTKRVKTLGKIVKQRKETIFTTQFMLHYCIHLDLDGSDKEAFVDVLIEEGIRIDEKNENGVTPLMLAIEKRPNNLQLVRQLLRHKPDVVTPDNKGMTPIHYCCCLTDEADFAFEVLQSLMSSGLCTRNLEERDSNQRTPLMHAILNTSHQTIDLIAHLIRCVKNVHAVDSGGNNALHLLMKSHFKDEDVLEVTKPLLKKGVDLLVQNDDGCNPVMYAINLANNRVQTVLHIIEKELPAYKQKTNLNESGLLVSCIKSEMHDETLSRICRSLIQIGQSIHEQRPEDQNTMIELALKAQCNRTKTVCALLQYSRMKLTIDIYSLIKTSGKLTPELLTTLSDCKIEVDSECKESLMPFHCFSCSLDDCDAEILSSLICLGFDINQPDEAGDTLFMIACRSCCHINLLEWLARKSDVMRNTRTKENYLHLLANSERDDIETRDGMEFIMGIKCPNINQMNNYKRTPLSESIRKMKMETIAFLIRNGASPNIKDRAGMTAVHHCVNGEWFDDKSCNVLDLLCKASPNFNILDNRGLTALNIAACHPKNSRIFTIIRLLENQSDVETVDELGNTPIHNCLIYLKGHKKQPVLERACRISVLKMYGVDPYAENNEGQTSLHICDNIQWKNRFLHEKEILRAEKGEVSKIFQEIVKDSFASLDPNTCYNHIIYVMNNLNRQMSYSLTYAAKYLHRAHFDIDEYDDEDDSENNVMSDGIDIPLDREFGRVAQFRYS